MTGNFFKSNYLYFTGLFLLVSGLPVSLFVTSLSQFILLGAFFLEGSPKEKFRSFLSNKAAVFFCCIWLMHLVGLLWTEDLAEGIKDLRIKLPLIILPIVLAGSKPLSDKQFRWILLSFVASVFVGSMISMAVLTGIIERNITDIRDVFIFHISHIRFALFTCLSIYILIWLAFKERSGIDKGYKTLSLLCILWFIVFLIIVESVTGLIILSLTGLLILVYYSYSSLRKRNKILLTIIVIAIPVIAIASVFRFVKDFYVMHPVSINTADTTLAGNPYEFHLDNPLYENGYPVWVYVSDEELRRAWNQQSKYPYDSLDDREQLLKFTLIHFLASKGLRKDAEGLSKLSDTERRAVERGIANVNYQEISNLRIRLHQIMWEFDRFINGGNPSGHSVTQRFEFWKAAIGISRDNPLLGVGTGDLPAAFHEQYLKNNSSLDPRHRHRTHNQYLAILAAFGIPGLLYFLFAYSYPVFRYREKAGFLFITAFMICAFSMIAEDTLETQPGATFVAICISLFLFARRNDA